MNREQKAAAVAEIAANIDEAQAIFAVDYRGLSVKQASDLRARLIEIDANLRVVKNTLTERAADEVGAEGLKQYLEGPTAFTFVKGDPVLAAKALAAFRRETQLPEFKGGFMDGKELTAADIEALSRLPSLEVMHGQLVGMIASPLTGLARSLNAILSGIAIALGQIQEKGLLEGNAAPAPAAEEPAAEAPAEAASDEAAEAPANDSDEGAETEAAAPAAEADAEPAAEAPAEGAADAPASDEPAADADAPAEAETTEETSTEEGDN
jgi:large subunit ribosomal protein L10